MPAVVDVSNLQEQITSTMIGTNSRRCWLTVNLRPIQQHFLDGLLVSSSTSSSSLIRSRVDKLLFGYCDYTDAGEPFYVGIGCSDRVRTRQRNRKHTNVANKYGLTRVVEVAAFGSENDVWSVLCVWEQHEIVARSTFSQPAALGCNFTSGGDGIRGFKRIKSPDECRKISESKKRLYANPQERQKAR